ncbi:hypothetical protein [Constantimarinum furrinae]|uniref:Uncharacterized protein n=1 Tax=Constantimarinum furrinae TaxID=2562285 RepID=A0A7G8PUS3_9FLAO|nr:hypothetical protein [Constantimarinum furrinae]QNJ98089.1 hypothetical protein ALE3EI_1531 [Constantimarinum furrinae]
MNPSNKHLFTTLKKEIALTFLSKHHAPASMKDWKGEDIVAFQEDLFSKTKARVSEKWFYTYFKNEPHKLPRIDMLNLLSNYTGYSNWNEFKTKHGPSFIKQKKNTKAIMYLIFIGLLIGISILYYSLNGTHEFRFCMVDEDQNEAISTVTLDIKILTEGQSPVYLKTDSNGCFTYETHDDIIKFVVQSPYHKTDTIIRHINTGNNPVVRLSTDDYALMLQYYSNGNVSDWEKRKEQLRSMISENAQIYQIYPQQSGIEMYSREDFISKLTIPTSSLKNIEILDKTYRNGQIVKLKFIVK